MNLKHLLSLLLVITVSASLFAQSNPFSQSTPANANGQHRCFTEELAHVSYNTNPQFQSTYDLARLNWAKGGHAHAHSKFADSIVRVPVVVHVIHNNGPENISLSQIESQIRILNEDFRKIAGTNGDGLGVDTKYEFFLAQKDPSGNCTDGVNRIQSTLTNHSTNDEASLKALIQWDPTRYLNMWVPNSIAGGVLGYARLPSGLPSQPQLDGVVIADDFFGDEGTSGSGQYGLGRTTTHEVGHWLGLLHPFNSGNCQNSNCNTQGDEVCDTPPTDSPTFGCPGTPPNKCGGPVQIDNYMDYTDDVCMSRFTAGQDVKMDFNTTTFRSLLLDSMNAINAGLYGCLGINYCQSGANNTSGTAVVNVNIETLNNSTANECTGYSDFTTSFTDLTQDSSYTLSVTTAHCSGGIAPNHEVKAFIDWNRDGDFYDAGEEYTVKANGPAGNGTVSITVPGNAPLDRTGMRIIAEDGGVTDPCGNYPFGETEDYALNIVAPPPTITAFNPTSGPIGSTVIITGDNFSGVSEVKFNNTVAPFYTILSDDSINVFVPTGATTGPLTVTSPQGFDISTGNYTVTTPAPAITNFTPASGPIGTAVQIFGSNFGVVSDVKFNGTSVTGFSQTGSTLIQTSVPAGATTGKIEVLNSVGTAISANDFTVTVVAPTAAISGTSTVCEGNTADITFNLTGSPPFDIVYTDGTNSFQINGISTIPHIETVTAPVGANTYTIASITDQNFTINAPDPALTGSATITVNDRPDNASLSGSASVCENDTVTFTFNATGGTSPYDIEINNGIGQVLDVIDGQTFDVVATSTTTYSLILVEDDKNCSTNNFTGDATYNVTPGPDADFNAQTNTNNGIVSFTDQSNNAVSWSWDFGDGNTSTVQNPVHVYQTVGIFKTTLSVTNADGCSDTYNENILILNVSGLEGLGVNESVNIYPNPAEDRLRADLSLDNAEAVQMEIMSTDGKTIRIEESAKSKNHAFDVNVNDLPSGMYLLRFSLSDGRALNAKVYKK